MRVETSVSFATAGIQNAVAKLNAALKVVDLVPELPLVERDGAVRALFLKASWAKVNRAALDAALQSQGLKPEAYSTGDNQAHGFAAVEDEAALVEEIQRSVR